MRFVVFTLCICAVLAGDEPCTRLEPVTIDHSYKKGEAFETDHMLALDNIRQAYENSDQGMIQITALRGNTAADNVRLVLRSIDAYKEPTDLFSLDLLTAYDAEGNVVATVHYSLNYTENFHIAPRLLSEKTYDDLLKSCKEVAKDETFDSKEILIRKDQYKTGFWRTHGVGFGCAATEGIIGALPGLIQIFKNG
ncbi:hypothetical protein Aduo_007811 [Ancylostoma duodenale]